MNPSEIEDFIFDAKDVDSLVAGFTNLNEKQRSKLSAAVNSLFIQLHRYEANKSASERVKNLLVGRKTKAQYKIWDYSALALFACCPVSTLKTKYLVFDSEKIHEAYCQILLDRQPEWLDEWIEVDLAKEVPVTSFSNLQKWIGEGICQKPTFDGYYLLFANYMRDINHYATRHKRKDISQRLQDSPELLDDVWGLFKIESPALSQDINDDQFDHERWPYAIKKLIEAGMLDRQKALDSCIDGLSCDLRPLFLSGLHRYYLILEPSRQELAHHQDEFINLLSHQVAHVSTFALAMLDRVEENGDLNCAECLDQIGAVFQHTGKGVATKAIKLCITIAKKHADQQQSALLAIAEGIQHNHADVQEKALDALDDDLSILSDEIIEKCRGYASFLSPTLTNRFNKIVVSTSGDSAECSVSDDPTPDRLEDLTAALTPATLDALGINGMLSRSGAAYQTISSNILEHTIEPTVELIEPIDTVDELISFTAQTVESVGDANAILRMVDGISRLCGDKDEEFEEKSAALLHRLNNHGTHAQAGIWIYGEPENTIFNLMLSWLTGKYHKAKNNTKYQHGPAFYPFINHLSAIAKRVAAGQAAPLLSTPTHSNGWIKPETWVQRLQNAETNIITINNLDFVFSMLRLMPDGRNVALKDARKLKGDYKRFATFVLGDQETLSINDQNDYELWITAARAKIPNADWSVFLSPLNIEKRWPDGHYEAEYAWRNYKKPDYYWEGDSFLVPDYCIPISTKSPVKKIKNCLAVNWENLPSIALNQRVKLRNIDEKSSSWSPGHGYLNGLFQKCVPWQYEGHLLLALGLCGVDADTKALALDAAVEGIDAGQFDPKMFAEVCTALVAGEWLKLNRLAASLKQITPLSIVHSWVISEAIDSWLVSSDTKQQGFFAILDVLYEANAISERAVSSDSRSVLGSIKGSSKSAKLAKNLLAQSESDSKKVERVSSLAIKLRIEAIKKL